MTGSKQLLETPSMCPPSPARPVLATIFSSSWASGPCCHGNWAEPQGSKLKMGKLRSSQNQEFLDNSCLSGWAARGPALSRAPAKLGSAVVSAGTNGAGRESGHKCRFLSPSIPAASTVCCAVGWILQSHSTSPKLKVTKGDCDGCFLFQLLL